MKTKLRFCICAILLLTSISTRACIQRYGTKIDGSFGRSMSIGPGYIMHRLTNAPPQSAWIEDEARLREAFKRPQAHFGVKSDYATTLLHLGRVREAVEILEPLLRDHPNEYALNANLGTAYELDGQLENGLRLIKRGVELNPDSHDGSEWIHVNILEARIASQKNPAWWKTHSVSGFDFGSGIIPIAPREIGEDRSHNRAVVEAIMYQLHERLQFVHSANQPVADLLFDLANYHAATDVAETADPIYQMALRYDEGHKPLIAERAAMVHQLATRFSLLRWLNKHGLDPVSFGFVTIIGALVCYYLFDLRRRRRAQMPKLAHA